VFADGMGKAAKRSKSMHFSCLAARRPSGYRLETRYKPPAEYSFRMLRDFANRASKWKQRLPLFVACSILVALSGLFMS
jgi:hypothetical protein